jgi:addiction module RelE/StbE family toxin
MAARTLRWTIRALNRLDYIGDYISSHNSEAASRIVMRISTAADALVDQPEMGRIGRIKDTRELVLADVNYVLAYRVTDQTIEILTVMHAAQNWPDRL